MALLNKYRVTTINNSDERKVSLMSEEELQKLRAKKLQDIRKQDLGMTQKTLADIIGVNLRTFQDWETGRTPMPKPVEILLKLMKEMPDVKEKLLNSPR